MPLRGGRAQSLGQGKVTQNQPKATLASGKGSSHGKPPSTASKTFNWLKRGVFPFPGSALGVVRRGFTSYHGIPST